MSDPKPVTFSLDSTPEHAPTVIVGEQPDDVVDGPTPPADLTDPGKDPMDVVSAPLVGSAPPAGGPLVGSAPPPTV